MAVENSLILLKGELTGNMTNKVSKYLLENNSPEKPGIKNSICALILQFYSRAKRRRVFAGVLLFVICIIVTAGIFAVLNVGLLTKWDSSYDAKSRTDFIKETTKDMEETTTAAINLATSALKGITWKHLDSSRSSNFTDLHFVDEKKGWVVGRNGTILATTDSGAKWTSQTNQISQDLYDVHFVNEKKGWVVGRDGTILATTDGGATWTIQTSGTSEILDGVHFVDAEKGWVVGWNGTILATMNGGETWIKQGNNTSQRLYGLYFLSAKKGWVVGTGGTIRVTTDGGATWTIQTSGTSQSLLDVHFVDAEKGWVVGTGGTIRVTTDGGATWTSQTSDTSQHLLDVHFADTEKGWVVGAGGTIRVTTDGGTTWTSQTSGTSQVLDGVHFVNAKEGWVVGWNGTILKSDKSTIKSITEQLKEVSNPSKILEILGLLRKRGLEYVLGQNDILQRIQTMKTRHQELEKLLKTPDKPSGSAVESFFGRYTIIRFGVMSFIAFFLQLLVSLYRYNMRLAAYYDARGDALFFAAQDKPDGLDALTEIFSPDGVDYRRSPNVATKQIIEVVKSLSQGIDTPRKT